MDERNDALETRRKRLVFRAWHRGIRETDLILGRFAAAHAGAFGEAEMEAFEVLLDVPDQDLLAWFTGAAAIPAAAASPMLDRVLAFHMTTLR